ncbi:PrgI family protein [Defluviitalea phaphyphila]|uniref:PrgI family protein n=1 Tax=Defluviitalea phaphyphila TaxID=1473580 RepID=UPI000A01BA24|nr:PrgI family protein [Defluviitalea phaphyphila]
MSIEVRIPKEITEYKEKILFGLSIRQLACFSLAIVTGVGTYYFANKSLGSDIASYIVILEVIPIFATGFVKKNNFTFEKYASIILKHSLRNNRRTYRTNLLIEEERSDRVAAGTKTKIKTKKTNKKRREVEGFKVTKKGRKRKSKEAIKEIKAARQEYRKKKQEIYKATEERSSTTHGSTNDKVQENV